VEDADFSPQPPLEDEAPPIDTIDAEGASEARLAPTDAAGWRALLVTLPSRELLRLVQKDKVRAARVLAGFRPAPDLLRTNPVVASRLVDEAQRQPAFAKELMEAALSPLSGRGELATNASAAPREAPTDPASSTSGTSLGEGTGERTDDRLRDKIKEQRAALRDKDGRIAALQAAVVAAQRERDGAHAEAEAAHAREKAAQTQAERFRRERERDEQQRRAARRPAADAPADEPPPPGRGAPPLREPAPAAFAYPVVGDRGAAPLWEEALRRLVSRGKFALVAEVCREAAQAATAAGSSVAGFAPIHALHAQALYGLGQAVQAIEEDRKATTAYLDAGDPRAASDVFARWFAAGGGPDQRGLLSRLFTLARRFGQEEAVRAAFARLRLADPPAFTRLGRLLAEMGAGAVAFLPAAPTHEVIIGPDEAISLPTGSVTARRLAAAVEGNDAALVLRARHGLARLPEAALADALFQAAEALSPVARVPLTHETRPVVVDASNVARHDPDPLALSPTPRVEHLLRMRDFLIARRFFPLLFIADANLRFHVDDRATYLALVERGVIRETPPGVVADAALIAAAREQNAPLVTNDRMADWDEARHVERLGFALLPDRVTLTPF